MSFILDALRKSEHDRQREKGPALAEVAVAPPKPRKNVWASVAVGLLVVNLVAVGVLLLRRADRSATRAAATTPALASSTPSSAPPVTTAPGTQAGAGETARSSAPSGTPTVVEPAPRPVPGTVPPVLQPALPAESGGGETRNPLADELSSGAAGEGADDLGYEDGYDNGAPYPTAPPGVRGNPASRRGSVVYETLPGAPGTSPTNARGTQNSAIAGGNVASPGTRSSSLPTLDELGMQTGLPELHVDLHVYSTRSQERFVFINSRRYKEGDTLQEGPHVDRITPEAVELSYRGNRFALPRQ